MPEAQAPPTPPQFPSEEPLTARTAKARKVLTARTFLLVVGTLLLLLICVIPLWDASRLLDDPTFVFFIGRRWPRWMIAACAGAIFIYVAMIVIFFRCSWGVYKTEQSVMMIGMIVCTALGLAFLCISQPLARESLASYTDLFFHCDYGMQTQRVYEYAMVLQLMRAAPKCAEKRSVEQCEGYQEVSPYTGFLRAMESRYKCSGFCWDIQVGMNISYANGTQPALPDNATKEGELGDTSLVQRSGRGGKLAGALQRLARQAQIQPDGEIGSTMDLNEEPEAVARAKHVDPAEHVGATKSYPPTLFSQGNYQVSCEGMAARSLKYEALDVARALFMEGLALLIITVFVSLIKLGSLCDLDPAALIQGSRRNSIKRPRAPKEVVL